MRIRVARNVYHLILPILLFCFFGQGLKYFSFKIDMTVDNFESIDVIFIHISYCFKPILMLLYCFLPAESVNKLNQLIVDCSYVVIITNSLNPYGRIQSFNYEILDPIDLSFSATGDSDLQLLF